MPDYRRSTSASTFAELPEPLLSALRGRVVQAGVIVPDDAPAYLCRNERLVEPSLLSRMTGTADRDPEHLVALVLAPQHALVAVHGEVRGTAVLAGRLEELEVGELPGVEDEGVSVTGFTAGADGRRKAGVFFVGLGPPDGAAARAALLERVK